MIDFNNACIKINKVTIGFNRSQMHKLFQQLSKPFNI